MSLPTDYDVSNHTVPLEFFEFVITYDSDDYSHNDVFTLSNNLPTPTPTPTPTPLFYNY